MQTLRLAILGLAIIIVLLSSSASAASSSIDDVYWVKNKDKARFKYLERYTHKVNDSYIVIDVYLTLKFEGYTDLGYNIYRLEFLESLYDPVFGDNYTAITTVVRDFDNYVYIGSPHGEDLKLLYDNNRHDLYVYLITTRRNYSGLKVDVREGTWKVNDKEFSVTIIKGTSDVWSEEYVLAKNIGVVLYRRLNDTRQGFTISDKLVDTNLEEPSPPIMDKLLTASVIIIASIITAVIILRILNRERF